MAPPGPATAPATPATSRVMERREQFLSARVLTREVVRVLTREGRDVRPAYVRLLVSGFIDHGYTTLAEIEPYVLEYLDPVGETAVRHVMHERGWR